MTSKYSAKTIRKSLSFISEAGTAMEMPRSHNKHLGNTFDTVASHQNHTSIIAYVICRLEGLSHDQAIVSMAMASMHDLPEVRTVDRDFVAKNYVEVNESKALDHLLKDLPFGQDLKSMIEEYEDRETLVAKCAKDADAIEQMYQEWVLSHRGNLLAKKWFKGDLINRVPSLRTKSAKKIALLMNKTTPDLWWWKDFVEDGINYEHLNSKK